ncbi:uncharacterized protein BO80DRAFT_348039 [Aspergillus ibericus CBS 121593]|uniref:Protein kinase domain-containing protein n=1 Tax=Aspergillus ibericus CBS 121593 TaxID=1448316 RepID=A0A395H999_9EURO|nr:hypothetical protein BO80DRAFT_348039 [Aspergillus ibericus CBS 121593]RAL04250.1 hypothetical protein BO80DRAFT_348039 [Aspergillus ibericus CBS 121593]
MEFDDVQPSEIAFQKKLFSSRFSVIFLVVVRNVTCVMKVVSQLGPGPYYEPDDRELDIHVMESTAYHRLKAAGVCDRGLVPDFFGSMRKFDPAPYQPHLKMFMEDEYPPSAIFLEYIPNLEMITIHNYTPQRMENLIRSIKEIHKAFVLHHDPKPRNMMVVKDDPERVIWLDFDRARTFDGDLVTDAQRQLLDEELEMVTCLQQLLEADCKKGRLEEAYILYCT